MKILIFKLGFLGDVIMSLPALVTLREKFPNAHITWIADKPVVPILEATQLVNRIVVLEENKLVSGTVSQRILTILNFWRRLGIGSYDLVISGHADAKVNFLLLPARAKEIRSFNRNGMAWKSIFPVPGRHHTYEFIKLFIGEEYPNATPVKYPLLVIPEVKEQIQTAKSYIVLAPGGTRSSLLGNGWLRRWPIKNYVALAERLHADSYNIALIGGKDDEWVVKHFGHLPINNQIGQLSVLETISFLSKNKLLITHDCGPLHFAVLSNISVIGIFGPTNPNEKIPLHGKAHYFWGGSHLTCRPCYDNKVYAPCRNNECICSVNIEMVLEKVYSFQQL